jgi:hypothetical protein
MNIEKENIMKIINSFQQIHSRTWLVLLLVLIPSVFAVTKVTGTSNDAAQINADLTNKVRVSTTSSSDNNYFRAVIVGHTEDRKSHSNRLHDQVLHGWCQYRSEHLTSL